MVRRQFSRDRDTLWSIGCTYISRDLHLTRAQSKHTCKRDVLTKKDMESLWWRWNHRLWHSSAQRLWDTNGGTWKHGPKDTKCNMRHSRSHWNRNHSYIHSPSQPFSCLPGWIDPPLHQLKRTWTSREIVQIPFNDALKIRLEPTNDKCTYQIRFHFKVSDQNLDLSGFWSN